VERAQTAFSIAKRALDQGEQIGLGERAQHVHPGAG
jgi:hypothetical protein